MFGLFRKRRNEQSSQPGTWESAQVAELSFWVQYTHHELGFTKRDQLVGFRLCEGRIHLCSFGYPYTDWMYSMDSPLIAGKVLDVGSSLVSVFEKCRSVSVVAIDPLLAEYRHALPDLVVLGSVNNCEYRSCRIEDVVETDFNVVWCNNVLDHTGDWREVIHHFARVLKPSGLLYLGVDVRSDESLLDEAHISAFTADEILGELKASGFEVIWQSPFIEEPKYRFSLRALKR